MSSVRFCYDHEILYPSEIATLSPRSILGSVTTNSVKVIYLVKPISAEMNMCVYFSVYRSKNNLCMDIFLKYVTKNETGIYYKTF